MTAATAESASAAAQGHLLNILNNGFQTILLSMGHRLGLFDVVLKHGPATSQTLAKESGYAERYVREWLNGLVAGQVLSPE